MQVQEITHTHAQHHSEWDREDWTTLEEWGPTGWHLNGRTSRQNERVHFHCSCRRSAPTSRYQTEITAKMAERRLLRIVLFTAESYISARAEQREIKATGKQRLQIYTIRPAAPNQPFRQPRSRRGNVRTAPVHVKWQAHAGDVCVWERGKKCTTEGW